MRITLFITCVNDTLFPAAGQATVRVLERLGHDVTFPAAQTCCGQMHVNSGFAHDALPLVRRFVDVFGAEETIVCPSASCAAMVREQYPRLAQAAGDGPLAARADRLGPRVHELSRFLVDELGVEDVGASFPWRVAYHPTCHSLRGLRLGDAPVRLLRAVRGLDLVDLADADVCCGFGGTFAIKNADVSTAMLVDKLARLRASGAEVCTAVDSSCLMHIGGGAAHAGAGLRTMHLAEILASDGVTR